MRNRKLKKEEIKKLYQTIEMDDRYMILREGREVLSIVFNPITSKCTVNCEDAEIKDMQLDYVVGEEQRTIDEVLYMSGKIISSVATTLRVNRILIYILPLPVIFSWIRIFYDNIVFGLLLIFSSGILAFMHLYLWHKRGKTEDIIKSVMWLMMVLVASL